MKIMRVVELSLVADKERLEYELEEVINNKDVTDLKIKKIRETLKKLTETMSAMQLWSSYIQGLNNNNNEEEEK
jgi:hypothetical protein|tara:strand:- start:43 stop:264 length:222 start_codon:yes stop_codon:yes gene_type:complete